VTIRRRIEIRLDRFYEETAMKDLTCEHFTPHLDTTFVIRADERVEVRLVEATEAGRPFQVGARMPFSLIFAGPLEPVLPQRIYSFAHPAMGELGIFIVPIGPDEKGTKMRYEAVFA
jgi:hypothetical protein